MTARLLFAPKAVLPFDPEAPPMLVFPSILLPIVRPVMYLYVLDSLVREKVPLLYMQTFTNLDLTAGRRRTGVP